MKTTNQLTPPETSSDPSASAARLPFFKVNGHFVRAATARQAKRIAPFIYPNVRFGPIASMNAKPVSEDEIILAEAEEAESFELRRRDYEEKEANSRLIAAAPALVAALELQACNMDYFASEVPPCRADCRAMAFALRAALAKAKGQP